MKTAILIALGSFVVTSAAPAFAEPPTPQNVSVVQTADLNLSTDIGRRALDQRLVIAAGEVCETASDVDLAGKNQVRKCRADVLHRARAQAEQIASASGDRTILIASNR